MSAALVALMFAGLSSAQAIGWVSWSLTAPTGKGSGQFTGSEVDHTWQVKGTITDYQAGDDCTKAKVSTRDRQFIWWEVKSITVCGGKSADINWSGTDPGHGNLIKLELCQKRTLRGDICSVKWLYLT